jgi:hypothetical protein
MVKFMWNYKVAFFSSFPKRSIFFFLRQGLSMYLGWPQTYDLPPQLSEFPSAGITAMYHHTQTLLKEF